MNKFNLVDIKNLNNHKGVDSTDKTWIRINNTDYVLKSNMVNLVQNYELYEYYKTHPFRFETFTILGELAYYLLSKKAYFNCVEVDIAECLDAKENVSYRSLIKSFNPNGDKQFMIRNVENICYKFDREYGKIVLDNQKFYSTENIIDMLGVFALNKKMSFNLESTEEELNKMAIVDFFFGQQDRNAYNIEIIADEKNKQFHIAPCFDNGMCLGFYENMVDLEKLNKSIKENKYQGISHDKPLYINGDYVEGKSFAPNRYSCGDYFPHKHFSEALLKQIWDLVKSDEKYQKFVGEIMKFNLKKELYNYLDNMEFEYNVLNFEKYIKVSNKIFEEHKLMFQKVVEQNFEGDEKLKKIVLGIGEKDKNKIKKLKHLNNRKNEKELKIN